MGTGLFLFLENKSSLNYLITEKVNGLVWSDHFLETEIVKLIKNKSIFLMNFQGKEGFSITKCFLMLD